MKRRLSCPNYGALRVSHTVMPWSALSSIFMCETKDQIPIRVRNESRRILEESTTHSSRGSGPDAGVILLSESQRATGRRCRQALFLGSALLHLFALPPLLELGSSVSLLVCSGLLMGKFGCSSCRDTPIIGGGGRGDRGRLLGEGHCWKPPPIAVPSPLYICFPLGYVSLVRLRPRTPP